MRKLVSGSRASGKGKAVEKIVVKEAKQVAAKAVKKAVHKQVKKQLRKNPTEKARYRKKLQKPIKSATSRLPRYIEILNDPFKMRGIKVPDLVSYPTGTFFTLQDVRLSTNADGECGLVIYPRPKSHYAYYSNTAKVSGNWAWTVADADQYSSINTSFAAIRPVAMGVLVEFYGPTTADGGYVSGTLYPKLVQTSGLFNPDGVNTGTNQLEASPYHIELPLKNSVTHRWRPMDNSELVFFTPSTVQSIGNLALGFTGMAANAVGSPVYNIKVRIFTHYEVIPNSDGFDVITDYGSSPTNLAHLEEAFNKMDIMSLMQPYIGYVNDGMKIAGMAHGAYRTFAAMRGAIGVGGR